MKKLVLIIIMVAGSFIWYGFPGKYVKSKNGNESSSHMPATNFTGADLTGANLAGVSLDGVILCKNTMPDGTINNTSCEN